jgi:hypothetical protein
MPLKIKTNTEIYMKSKRNRRIGRCLIAAVVALTTLSCKNNVAPPQFSGPLELLQPKGGSGVSFTVGESVLVKWFIHDQSKIGSVRVDYSLDNGKTWSANPLFDNSYTYPETSRVWTPTIAETTSQFMLKVREYNDPTIYDKSAAFVVHK